MYRQFFQNKNFLKMSVADAVSHFGDSVDSIAFTWLTYDLSRSASMSALVFALNLLPTAVFQPIVGPIAERCRKKPVMISLDIVRAVLVLFTLFLYISGLLQPWMMLVLTFVMNSAEALRSPCGTAYSVRLLEQEDYESCFSLAKILQTAAQLAGLALGGILTSFWIAGAFLIDMFTFVFSAVCIAGITYREAAEAVRQTETEGDNGAAPGALKKYINQMKGGLHYLFGNQLFLLLIVAAILFNMVSSVLSALIAPYAAELFGGGGEVVSVINTAITGGMLLGMFFFPKVSERIDYKMQLVISYIATAVYMVLLLAAPFGGVFRYFLLAALSFAFGVCTGVITNLFNVLFVKTVDQDYMARATGIFNSSVTLASPAVSFVIAALVKVVPLRGIFLAGALCSTAAAACFAAWKTADLLKK